MTNRFLRWCKLILGLALLLIFGMVAHRLSPKTPGIAGEVFSHNRAGDINASANFYSEVGDLNEFLSEEGKYGAAIQSRQKSCPGKISARNPDE